MTGSVFCAECGELEPFLPSRTTWDAPVFAAGAYSAPLSTAILRMKFSHRPDLAARLGELFEEAALERFAGHWMVPVPLHPARLAERGFNQSALLARVLARRARAHYAPSALERPRDTGQQSLLSAEERQSNVLGAFRARRDVGGAAVVLVDDVITTGATVEACSTALRAANAGPISVLTLAAA